jgi:hypothetical protein
MNALISIEEVLGEVPENIIIMRPLIVRCTFALMQNEPPEGIPTGKKSRR